MQSSHKTLVLWEFQGNVLVWISWLSILHRLSRAREHWETRESEQMFQWGWSKQLLGPTTFPHLHSNTITRVLCRAVTCLDTYRASSTFRERELLNGSAIFSRCMQGRRLGEGIFIENLLKRVSLQTPMQTSVSYAFNIAYDRIEWPDTFLVHAKWDLADVCV